ncbi:MAG: anhydro-N-acetylmuramic acid kinase [Bacteroidetes bacterium]|nr:anhydro-N-acetylmuramic acid kinase [Bacteroidota bacterium]
MKQLFELSQKPKKLVIGLMSGTSVDGIDAVLVEIEGSGTDTRILQLDFITVPFPAGFKAFVLRNSQTDTSDVSDITRLNFLLAQLYAKAVKALCKHANVAPDEVDLIGSHGQTIHHLPDKVELYNERIAATLQIGDPSVLAKLTGIVTIGDFRVADMAFGGQGAPLVPYFDYLLFRSDKASRALLNIGGIANITYLPDRCEASEVLAFDTGPGNMVVDQIMKIVYDKEYDEDGQIAFSGQVQEDMTDYLMKDEYVTAAPPKSTGRERYGSSYVSDILSKFSKLRKEDIVATVTDFTARAVYENFNRFLSPTALQKGRSQLAELFVSGGGAQNKFLLHSLGRYFAGTRVAVAENLGISSDAKEAICFAVLANETISGNPANLPQVTGASKRTVLGKICLP